MRPQEMKGCVRFLENILLFGNTNPQNKDDIIILSAHRHTALTMISLQIGNSSSVLCNTVIGSLVGRNYCFVSFLYVRHSSLLMKRRQTRSRKSTVQLQKLRKVIQVSCYVQATETKTVRCC